MPSHGLSACDSAMTGNPGAMVSMPSHGLSACAERLKELLAYYVSMPSHGLSAWTKKLPISVPIIVSMPSHGLSAWTNLHKNYPSQSFYLSAYPYYTSKFPVRQSSFNKFYGIFSHSLHLPLVRTSPFLSADCGLSSTNL